MSGYWWWFIVSAALLWLIRKKLGKALPSGKAAGLLLGFLEGVLLVVAGVSFFNIWPGELVLQLAYGVIGWTPFAVGDVIFLVVLVFTVAFFADVIKDRKLDGAGSAALFLLPTLAGSVGGPLGALWGAVADGAFAIIRGALSMVGG